MFGPVGKTVIVILASAAVIGAVAGGLSLLGPPSEERARRFDERRLEDLQGIERSTDLYLTRHGRLAASLDELSAEAGVNISAREPDTARSYEYRVVDPKTYELCATFQRDSAERNRSFWSHGVGRRCFQLKAREISHP
jgi:hypothetical protein